MADLTNDYPLECWRLGGFRSIRDLTTFHLGGLNLLVGANSAGKSSVLNSVLLAAQTLGNPLADRALVLNGQHVRLGLPEDIIHARGGQALELGFTLRALPSLTGTSPSARMRRRQREFERLSVLARFTHTGRRAELDLEAVEAVGDPSDVDQPQHLTVTRRTIGAGTSALTDWGVGRDTAREAARDANMAVEGSVPASAVGARTRQFLPDQVLVVRNRFEDELERLRWPYLGYDAFSGSQDRRRARQTSISPPLLHFIAEFVRDARGSEVAAAISGMERANADNLAAHLDEATWTAVQDLAATDWFEKHKGKLPIDAVPQLVPPPDAIAAGIQAARRFFATSTHHLGPLRAGPQPLHNLPEAASGTSVGRNGEFTAAVLNAHAERNVLSPDPSGGGARPVPLGEAVNEWVAEMQLLASVHATERGKLGYELHVSIEGLDRDLDLTTVGVGVSQALPIVVLGLISQPGSLLLFEQPELHLHPDVQAALGDFFAALARSGRQLIVETHSEYLINRLRRRAAEVDTDIPELVRLFFFERHAAASEIMEARIAPGGGMPGWPRGFLDTAAREIEAIARTRVSGRQQ